MARLCRRVQPFGNRGTARSQGTKCQGRPAASATPAFRDGGGGRTRPDGKQMIEELCPMEASVLLARRTGQWTEMHERHIADCANCRELLKVAGFMNGIADSLRRDPSLPDPVLVWLKAQWIEREESH